MQGLLKQIFFLLAPKLRLNRSRAVILMYHSVNERIDSFSNVNPTTFTKQMEVLHRSGRETISLTELLVRLRAGKPLNSAVVITFDDGCRDNLIQALPVLKRYAFPATVFVVTDLIGKTDKNGLEYMTAEELKEMQRSGIEIGAHTKSHQPLTKLAPDAQKEEIAGSRSELKAALGTDVRLFAAPYGKRNPEIDKIVVEAGFDGAVSVIEGTVRPSSSLYCLPRVSIDRSTTMAQFKGKLTRAVDLYESLKSAI